MTTASKASLPSAVVVVAPFSTGEKLAELVRARGYQLVLVFLAPKAEDNECNMLSCAIEGDFEVFHEGSLEDTAAVLRALPVHIKLVQPGAENGVLVSDQLAQMLGTTHNSPKLSAARRSKFLMGKTIADAGVPATRQHISTEWESVAEFLADWNPDPFKVIVKPNSSAGSDDVFKCHSVEEVRRAFDTINGSLNGFGEVNDGVLVMEFLEGQEYVVDSVSRDGDHRVVAIWKYDKRSYNNQFNVLFGMEIAIVNSELEEALVQYSNQVLDALQLEHGPSHMEIILTRNGPRLVEVGARCHGASGTWIPLANAALGTNQLDATLDAFLEPERFSALPPYPVAQRSFVRSVFLPSGQHGVVRALPGVPKIQALPSFNAMDVDVKPGSRIHKTIDLFTMPGRVSLVADDEVQVEHDYAYIHDMVQDGALFDVAPLEKCDIVEHEGPEEETC